MDEMKDAAFTKGPWEAGWGNGLTGPTCPVSNPTVREKWPYEPVRCGEETVAIAVAESDMAGAHRGQERPIPGSAQSRARLIAAAPEMYEALKAALTYLDAFGCDKDMAPTMDKIEAALQKAEGR